MKLESSVNDSLAFSSSGVIKHKCEKVMGKVRITFFDTAVEGLALASEVGFASSLYLFSCWDH